MIRFCELVITAIRTSAINFLIDHFINPSIKGVFYSGFFSTQFDLISTTNQQARSSRRTGRVCTLAAATALSALAWKHLSK
jgi:hypothetical protein